MKKIMELKRFPMCKFMLIHFVVVKNKASQGGCANLKNIKNQSTLISTCLPKSMKIYVKSILGNGMKQKMAMFQN